MCDSQNSYDDIFNILTHEDIKYFDSLCKPNDLEILEHLASQYEPEMLINIPLCYRETFRRIIR